MRPEPGGAGQQTPSLIWPIDVLLHPAISFTNQRSILQRLHSGVQICNLLAEETTHEFVE